MESKFTFLESRFPKLSDLGRKAEHSLTSDPNICLICLGRIADLITDNLCRRNNIHDLNDINGKLSALTQKLIIPEIISRKILTLTDIKNDAAFYGYDSVNTCSRLIQTAEELCRWFEDYSESKFSFLADLYPPDKPVPILMNLAEIGREAEENLFANTRYCLICLGDIGEAAADRLISGNSIETHEKDQIDRIDILAEKYIIPDEIRNILHRLRMARNKAVHERYNDEYISETKTSKLLNDALKLCKWIFILMMKPGYIVKAKITARNTDGYSALIGEIPAYVPDNEVSSGKICESGKKYVFKIIEADSERITLSLNDADKDYNLSLGRLYAKYKIGQDLHVTIKSLSNSTGALVELKDGLEARIPPSELGRKIYGYDRESREKIVRFEVTARVKWFSLTQYPPMLLSVKDLEDEENENITVNVTPEPPEKSAMSDLDFRLLCKSAPHEKIIEALDNGANPNAANSHNTTALMMAAQFNRHIKSIKKLIDAGADINAVNSNGNTALMYAAMRNNPEIVKLLIDEGADIEKVNSNGKKAADYAAANRKLNGTDLVRLLRNETKEQEQQKEELTVKVKTVKDADSTNELGEKISQPEHEEDNDNDSGYYVHETDSIQDSEEDIALLEAHRINLQKEFLRICRSATEDEIAEAVSAGVNVNTTNKSSATALMFAAQSNTAEAVEYLIHAGARINAQDSKGNTALIYAASFNDENVVAALLDGGADKEITNLEGRKAGDYAVRNYRLNDSEVLSRF